MNWFWLNIPLAAAFFAAWVGVPMWLVLKHPGHAPAARTPAPSDQAPPAPPQPGSVPDRSTELVGV